MNPKNDSVFGEGYPASQSASLTVDDSDNGEGVDYCLDIECDESGKFGVADIGFDVTATDTVTITRGVYSKSHTVTTVKTGGIEQSSDLVTGTATPGTDVSVYIMDQGEPMPARHTTADGSGLWSVSFETSVSPDPEGAAVDIGPGVRGYAEQRDADLDSTQDDWRIPRPWLGVGIVDDGVWGGDFLSSADVTVTIDDTTVAGIEYTTVVLSDDIGNIFARPIYGDGESFDIRAEMVVTATDGTRVASHEVRALTVDEANTTSDIVTGTAEPSAAVQVVVYLGEGEAPMRFVTADGEGVWTADFTVASDIYGWAQPYDIPPGQHMTAIRNAQDGGHTQIDFYMPVQPVAVSDDYEIDEDGELDTGDEGVRDNDTRSGFWDDVVEVVQDAAHGDLAVQPDGTFRYIPGPDFHGEDWFLYRLRSGDLTSNVATAGITVHGVADATALTVTSSNAVVAYGGTYTFAGRLMSGAAGVSGARVVLQQATSAAGPWSDTSLGATTTATGTFSVAVRPYYKRYYRVRFAALADEYLASASTARYALPRAWVGNPVAPATMYTTRTYWVYGFMKPRHTAAGYPVRIYRWRYEGGAWKAYGYVPAKAYDYSTYTKYLASVRLPYKGYWRLRAYAPADAWHAAAWSSAYDTVLVK